MCARLEGADERTTAVDVNDSPDSSTPPPNTPIDVERGALWRALADHAVWSDLVDRITDRGRPMTSDEIEHAAGSLLSDGCLDRDDARRIADVLLEVAADRRRVTSG